MILALLFCFPRLGLEPTIVRASVGYTVHNLDTGLNYTTIQEAIGANETLDGQTIYVESGVYHGSVVCGKNLTIVGEDRDSTIIDGDGSYQTVLLTSNQGGEIRNFTVRNGGYGIVIKGGIGFFPSYTGVSVIDNLITGNAYGGISLEHSANTTVVGNIITSNALFGIDILYSGYNLIVNNSVAGNGHGIVFYGNSNDNVLRNNSMSGNAYNFGLIVRGETMNWLSGYSGRKGIVNDVDTSNTVDGKPIYYWVGRHDEQVPSDAGYVWLDDCSNITVKNLNLSHNIEGILLLWANNTVIEENQINQNGYGIWVELSENNTFSSNILANNSYGIVLGDSSRFTTMRNNSISGGQINFTVDPYDFSTGSIWNDNSELINDIDLSNVVDGKPIVYWIGQHNTTVPSDAGCVKLINCTNIVINGLDLTNNWEAISIKSSSDILISNSLIGNTVYGIKVESSSIIYDLESRTWVWTFPSANVTVQNNTLFDDDVACELKYPTADCLILNNTLERNPVGILAYGLENSTIAGNTVKLSNMSFYPFPSYELHHFVYPEFQVDRTPEVSSLEIGGILQESGAFNTIYDNTVEDGYFGILAIDYGLNGQGPGNLVCHNNIINNVYQWGRLDSGYSWDFGYPSGGNYWSDYSGKDISSGPSQNMLGSDGIGDTLYYGDRYPLISVYNDTRDVAISGTWAYRVTLKPSSETVNITITVINLSLEPETVNVTLQTNTTIIAATQNLQLPMGKQETLNFEWNTTALTRGTYSITASITPVPGETRTADNIRNLSVLTLPGDLNADGTIDKNDADLFVSQFNLVQGKTNWDSSADFNGDGTVDIFDAILLAANFGYAS
jgi:parallel beta-helix repeat protein